MKFQASLCMVCSFGGVIDSVWHPCYSKGTCEQHITAGIDLSRLSITAATIAGMVCRSEKVATRGIKKRKLGSTSFDIAYHQSWYYHWPQIFFRK